MSLVYNRQLSSLKIDNTSGLEMLLKHKKRFMEVGWGDILQWRQKS